jgi:hypothetical protein
LPVAFVPLWQLKQVPVMPVCLNVAGVQPVVLWQSSQVFEVAKCVAFLPVAFVPLWQLKQLAVMPVCLNVAGLQAAVL